MAKHQIEKSQKVSKGQNVIFSKFKDWIANMKKFRDQITISKKLRSQLQFMKNFGVKL